MLQRFKASSAAQQWFTTSPVTLGIGRVGLGLLVLGDVLRRWGDLDVWYTNAGLMPNHTMLWAPQARMGISIFFSVSQLYEARFFVVLIVLVDLLFLVGYRTKLMHALALLAQVSLNCRVHYLTNGGDVALSVLLLWTLFLPLGEWLSVDALLLAMKRSRLKDALTLEVDPAHPDALKAPQPRFDWAAGALVAQLAVIYFFNFVHKDGSGWREGRVLLDVLNQNRIATPLAVWFRPHLTPELSLLLTRFTQGVEAGLPVLALLPVRSLWVRRAAVVLGIGLHLGFATFINLGVFSEAMMCFWLFLVPHEDWVWLLSRFKPKPRTVEFDPACGGCRVVAHALRCIEAHSVVERRFVLQPKAGAKPVLAVLHGGLLTPREGFAVDTPWRKSVAGWAENMRLGLLLFMAAVFVMQTLAQNRAVPSAIKPDPPPFWVQVPVEYLHFYQGWGMFAESPREDYTVVVRGTTVDGRLVDPLSERSSSRSPPGIHAIADRLDHNEFWCDYLSRISGDRAYEPPLRDWILAYPQRTGNPNDQLKSFDLVEVRQVSPLYGQTEGTNVRERLLMHWP
jgi:hypothetical protein